MIPKVIMYQALHNDHTKLMTLEMLAMRNFFFAECKTSAIWNRVTQTIIYTSTKQQLFKQCTEFRATFKQIIVTITKVFSQRPAEKAINLILDQVDSFHRTQACNAVLSCLQLTRTSTVFTSFSLSLLTRMKEHALVPSAEAYSCVIDRFLSRVMMNSPKSPDYIETVLDLYRSSLQHTTLEEWVYISMLSAMTKIYSKNKVLSPDSRLLVSMREVAAEMISCGYKVPRPLAQPLLHSLLPADPSDTFLQVHVRKPLEPWGSKAILALWDSVMENPSLPNDRCLLIISHCYPILALQSFKARRNLNKMFQSYLSISDPSCPATYIPMAAAYGLIGDVVEIEKLRDLLKENKAYPDTSLLNTMMRSCLNAGDGSAALLNFHIYIESSANRKRFMPLVANQASRALAVHAACKANDFVLLQRLYSSLFDESKDAPLTWFEYHHVLTGLHDAIADAKDAPKGKVAVYSDWSIAQVEAILKHMKDTGYNGPTSSLYQLAVKSHANYLKGIKSKELVRPAYQALIASFNSLIRDFSANLDASACPAFFKSMGTAVKLEPALVDLVAADTMDIYHYFVDSGTKIECLTYCCILNLLGSMGRTQLIDKIFDRFLVACRCGSFSDNTRQTTVFNTYFRNVSIKPGKIPELLAQMAQFKAYPDDHTFLQLIRNVSQQDASSFVLYDILYKILDCYSAPAGNFKFNITPSLLGAVAIAFHKAGGATEMTKALNYTLAIDSTNSLEKKLPPSLYKSIIELTLVSEENNTGAETMLWVNRLNVTKNTEITLEILDLVEKADPYAFPYLTTPESLTQLKKLRESVDGEADTPFKAAT
ncbi:hypothetical protein DSO57_1000094 [Entomophthora muscae]|uniref:Uncharacterized protein n=1 Tax=Entomophthora muscae TaxID=34485 RepID=A0ACC2SMK0_9FUNG|nr:hypothetical protein DSO57_1000094 [Entomophthora muscae]